VVDELDAVEPAPAASPLVVYLVANSESREYFSQLGLADGEVVLVAGTAAEQATAWAAIAARRRSVGKAVSPAVQVVDLRPRPAAPPNICGQSVHDDACYQTFSAR
jgi:hypothetical protein